MARERESVGPAVLKKVGVFGKSFILDYTGKKYWRIIESVLKTRNISRLRKTGEKNESVGGPKTKISLMAALLNKDSKKYNFLLVLKNSHNLQLSLKMP